MILPTVLEYPFYMLYIASLLFVNLMRYEITYTYLTGDFAGYLCSRSIDVGQIILPVPMIATLPLLDYASCHNTSRQRNNSQRPTLLDTSDCTACAPIPKSAGSVSLPALHRPRIAHIGCISRFVGLYSAVQTYVCVIASSRDGSGPLNCSFAVHGAVDKDCLVFCLSYRLIATCRASCGLLAFGFQVLRDHRLGQLR
ncbi:hypothetical protein BDP81DRAFT_112045 [Colletotrichum phormii]|uniref:Uncharacterized protein n=1 Tax=Colletotrichum phormii TaxID=359342 RepID=A0AAJ0EBY1_9PEZI|nr:uncharacterized protein BDP81DRAFT_112045 [Colletotrichum phormii]KAK1624168.1 hypothetical protein BDP81DRAFT_112045 [Colletotrichum phormii]